MAHSSSMPDSSGGGLQRDAESEETFRESDLHRSTLLSVANSSEESESESESLGLVQNRSSRRISSTTEYRPLVHHGSCKEKCKKRMFDAVLHFPEADRERAVEIKKWFENLLLMYLGKLYKPRVELLPNVSGETIYDAVDEAVKITENIIILSTEELERDKHAFRICKTIMSIVSHQSTSTVVTQLCVDGSGLFQGMVKKVTYLPESTQFQTEMKDLLLGQSFKDRVHHDDCRKRCETKQKRQVQQYKSTGRGKKYHRVSESSSDVSSVDERDTFNTHRNPRGNGRPKSRRKRPQSSEDTSEDIAADLMSASRVISSSDSNIDRVQRFEETHIGAVGTVTEGTTPQWQSSVESRLETFGNRRYWNRPLPLLPAIRSGESQDYTDVTVTEGTTPGDRSSAEGRLQRGGRRRRSLPSRFLGAIRSKFRTTPRRHKEAN